jgi:hypothetical protein
VHYALEIASVQLRRRAASSAQPARRATPDARRATRDPRPPPVFLGLNERRGGAEAGGVPRGAWCCERRVGARG